MGDCLQQVSGQNLIHINNKNL